MAAKTFDLSIEPRTAVGRKVRALRRDGQIPVVIYGLGKEPVIGQVPDRAFAKLYSKAGESSIVNISMGSETVPTLIQDVTYEPIMDTIQHVDFLRLDMTKEVHATVQLKHVGAAPAVKEFSGVVVTPRDHVRIRCLPSALVHEIEIDLATLDKIGDSVHVKDLKVPEGITVEESPDVVLVMIAAPRAEETAKTPEVAAATPAEGAAPAAEGAAAAPAEAAKAEKK